MLPSTKVDQVVHLLSDNVEACKRTIVVLSKIDAVEPANLVPSVQQRILNSSACTGDGHVTMNTPTVGIINCNRKGCKLDEQDWADTHLANGDLTDDDIRQFIGRSALLDAIEKLQWRHVTTNIVPFYIEALTTKARQLRQQLNTYPTLEQALEKDSIFDQLLLQIDEYISRVPTMVSMCITNCTTSFTGFKQVNKNAAYANVELCAVNSYNSTQGVQQLLSLIIASVSTQTVQMIRDAVNNCFIDVDLPDVISAVCGHLISRISMNMQASLANVQSHVLDVSQHSGSAAAVTDTVTTNTAAARRTYDNLLAKNINAVKRVHEPAIEAIESILVSLHGYISDIGFSTWCKQSTTMVDKYHSDRPDILRNRTAIAATMDEYYAAVTQVNTSVNNLTEGNSINAAKRVLNYHEGSDSSESMNTGSKRSKAIHVSRITTVAEDVSSA